jgi:hypothetical protein
LFSLRFFNNNNNNDNNCCSWATFRSLYPDRPFCLVDIEDGCCGGIDRGTAFSNDVVALSIIDDIPGVRDNDCVALGTTPCNFTDWWDECWGGVTTLPGYPNFPFIGLFVDNSGSLVRDEVKSALDAFFAKAAAAGITIVEFVDGNERWIEPFLPGGLLAPSP